MIVFRFVFLSMSLLVIQNAGCSYGLSLDWQNLPLREPERAELQLLHYPEAGTIPEINPPGFTWSRHPEASAYRFILLTDNGGIHLTLDSLTSSVAILDQALEPGPYAWVVLYLDKDGSVFGRSRRRDFTLSEGTPRLVLPSMADLKAELGQKRPRLFLKEERKQEIHEAAQDGRILLWDEFRTLLSASLEEPLYPEPAPYKNGEETTPEWRRIYTPAKTGSAHMVRLALGYHLLGDEKYLKRSQEWLMHLTGWDPRGIISHDVPQPDGTIGNDEGSMALLERMAITYDWIYSHLNDKQKAAVRESMRERGDQVLEVLKQQDFLSNPFSNHEGRVLAFLGLAGLSMLGELPEAEAWLDYVLRCYLSSFPPWGGEDGGWAQGVNYWSAYLLWLTEFADALRTATDTDIYQKPFFRNTGYFGLFFHPPYSPRGAFGDGGEVQPNLSEKLLLLKLAAAHKDPVLLWHSNQIDFVTNFPEEKRWFEWFMEDVHSVLQPVPPRPVPHPPREKAASRFMENIGWVAAHSRLGDAADDVWVLFKSSRFGSFSHSHADQNSFQLNAYGQPLLIDSGYYPYYGSPHHNLWTRQTRAHNAILIEGRGQPIASMAAEGRIEFFQQRDHVTVARGEAAAAYNIPPRESVARQWKEVLGEPYPDLKPRAEVVRRTLAFVASERPWMVVHDYLETDAPATFSYLLHSQEPMQSKGEGHFRLKQGEVVLDIYLISDQELEVDQQNHFPVPPEERKTGAKEQSHLTARTAQKSRQAKYLAIFIPSRNGETPPRVKPLRDKDATGFQVGEESVLAWWGEGERGPLLESGKEARFQLKYQKDGSMKSLASD